MKKKEDEVEKLIQLSVLMGMGIATVFHFLRKICGSEKEMYSNITFIVKEHWRSCFCWVSHPYLLLGNTTRKAIF